VKKANMILSKMILSKPGTGERHEVGTLTLAQRIVNSSFGRWYLDTGTEMLQLFPEEK